MKTLETLIKLQQREMDTIRQQLTMLEDERAMALAQIAQADQDIEREAALGEAAIGWADMLTEFVGRMERRKDSLRQKVKRIDVRLEQLRERLREQFAEVKKYEIVRDNRMAEAQKTLEKQMQTMLDEIGMQLYQRKG